MLTQQEYIWAWFFYLLGVALFMVVAWFATAKLKWREPRYLIRIVLATFFLVPWYTQDESAYLSPAWLISLIEGAFEGPEHFWRAGTPLLFALLISLIISSVISFTLWFKARKQA